MDKTGNKRGNKQSDLRATNMGKRQSQNLALV